MSKTPLPIPKFGGAPAGAKPLAPTTPLIKAEKRYMPPAPRPRKQKRAFAHGQTAFSTNGTAAFTKR